MVPTATYAPAEATPRYAWLTPDRLVRVRAILLALTLFFGLVVWVYHGVAAVPTRNVDFLRRLRGVGIMTWLWALVQMVDMRFYNSRFAQRRRAAMRIPESLYGWLFAQMLAWFGIVYYALTESQRWYAAGLALLFLSFLAFPIRRSE